jgi:excinuclease ABC subunit C
MIEIRRHPLDDPSRAGHLEALLGNSPTGPGVYMMKGEDGKVMYVGKAKSLRSRVRSYFQRSGDLSVKTQHLVLRIYDIEFMVAGTEIEALLLENNLIKKWKPKYNIRLKDDKTYPYVRLDLSHDYPRPYIARRQKKGDGSRYFGPFTDALALRELLRSGAKVFQLRDCRDFEFSNRSRPCLSYEIGQCTAPCVGLVKKDAYQLQVDEFTAFLEGRQDRLIRQWETDMSVASESLNYERAALIRDRIARVQGLVEQEQRMVQTDQCDRDVWAYWPRDFSDKIFLLMVLQFRKGKFVGRMHWSSADEEALETEDFLGAFLLAHYSKHPLPCEVVVPDESMALDRAEFSHALVVVGASVPEPAASEGEAEADDFNQVNEKSEAFRALAFASDNAVYANLMVLADQQAEQVFTDKKRRLEQSQDALLKIARFLKLEKPPKVMECIDISNFQGEANVASCVVFVDGRPDKSQYRHYKIQGFDGQNDFKSLQELVTRRYLKPDSPRPDLLVVDGGRAQLASVSEILDSAGLTFPVVGLAKARTESDFASEEVQSTEERIFFPGQKNAKTLKDPDVKKTLTHLRDEAHRFAIEFHRKQRSKNRGF